MWDGAPVDQRWFLALVPAALAGAAVAGGCRRPSNPGDGRSDVRAAGAGAVPPMVLRLAGLFAVDSFAGGFTVSAFIAYWFAHRFDTSAATLGLLFAAVGVLQTLSFLAAGRLADRFGLLTTMVATHLPSNLLLAAMAFAPSFPVAVGLLLARVVLSQMDVPTRQAYVMALVSPAERTAAAATANSARYLTRPFGAMLGNGRIGGHRRPVPRCRVHEERLRHRALALVPHRATARGSQRMIVCLRTVGVPPGRDRYLAWINEAEPSAKPTASSPSSCSNPPAATATPWWSLSGPPTRCSTPGSPRPSAGALTASDVHRAVDYGPITRFEVSGGYLDLAALAAGPDTFPTEEEHQ